MPKKKLIYKVIFINQGKVYEIYAKQVTQSGMWGFIEVEGLFFGETSELVIDPVEERLKAEFSGVERTYIPMNAVVRVDEVQKRGENKISPLSSKSDNVAPFPTNNMGVPDGDRKES
ncbi:MAG: DUF1820 family protein [SAR324 cluster bacterium]|nr:DUF1820 family protein [SAR324 cluster bacterium]